MQSKNTYIRLMFLIYITFSFHALSSDLNEKHIPKDTKIKLESKSKSIDSNYETITQFEDTQQAYAYAIGMDYAQGIISRYQHVKSLGLELDLESIQHGIIDTIKNELASSTTQNKTRLNQAELKSLIYGFDRQLTKAELKKAQALALDNLSKEKNYLKINAKKKNVITLKSGLQYKVIEHGDGIKPHYKNKVVIDFTGKLTNGHEFASSFGKNADQKTFKMSQMIAGWSEALLLMNLGDKWEITLPAKLGFGSSQHGIIPANSVLIYQIKLLKIE